MWRMAIVDGLEPDGIAVVVAFHHVLSDGMGALSMLAALVDGSGDPAPTPDPHWPAPMPDGTELRRDATRARLAEVRSLPRRVRQVLAAAAQLRPRGRRHATPCSLLAPNGPTRRIDVVDVELTPLHDVAREHHASVNDAVLTAISAALSDLLDARGEHIDALVVSVPVSGRADADATDLGNQVGAVPVELSTDGDDRDRLVATAAATAVAKRGWRGATDAILGPLFRVLAAIGLLRRFIDRQHLVHTFVTNLRGPSEQLALFGRRITDVHIVAVVPGNVTVSFAVFSYAGRLGITVVSDPDHCPDVDVLIHSLREHLDGLSHPSG